VQQASTAGALDDRSLNRRVRRSKKTLVASSGNSGTRRGVPPPTHREANVLVSLIQPGVVVAGELVWVADRPVSFNSASLAWTLRHLLSLSRGWVILIRPGSHCLAGRGDF